MNVSSTEKKLDNVDIKFAANHDTTKSQTQGRPYLGDTLLGAANLRRNVPNVFKETFYDICSSLLKSGYGECQRNIYACLNAPQGQLAAIIAVFGFIANVPMSEGKKAEGLRWVCHKCKDVKVKTVMNNNDKSLEDLITSRLAEFQEEIGNMFKTQLDVLTDRQDRIIQDNSQLNSQNQALAERVLQLENQRDSGHDCTVVTEEDQEVLKKLKIRWICDPCTYSEVRKSLNNVASPTKENDKAQKIIMASLDELKKEVRDLRYDLKFYAEKYEEQQKKNLHFDTEIEALKVENAKIMKELSRIKGKHDNNDLRIKNIIMMGIKSSTDETEKNPDEIKQRASKVLSFIDPNHNISIDDIRLINKKENTPILVSCKTLEQKLNFMKRRKGQNHCGFSGSNNIFLNEDLSKENRELLKKARSLRDKEYKYVWTVAGKIYVRKEDKSEKIRIFDESDLAKLS
ncbi:unnamed protein product [Brassicogethes aeneus]|uniref:FP protein C-terminal domain-containing protein n=1 Tax=Brassicogethes aeneus TaxID=1431903 RepID=A0A9P0FM25_BRAAE|nr:unnamed protein product [Brassicogethes aeneus]